MSGNPQIKRRVVYTQLEMLYKFLNEHRELANGFNKTALSRQLSKELWARAADLLNSAGDGAVKTSREWCKYWVDLKSKIKKKNRINKDASNKIGGDPPEDLSDVEQKFLSILSENSGSGLPMKPANQVPDAEPVAEPSGINEGTDDESKLEEWLEMPVCKQEHEETFDDPLELPSPAVWKPTAMTSARSPEIETSEDPCPSRPMSAVSAEPIVIQAPNKSQPATKQRRKRQRHRPLTASEARVQLVKIARQRADSEAANSTMLREALCLFRELVSLVRTRYSGEESRGLKKQ